MAGGISAGRSGETLFHKGERIPLGLTPWNQVCAVRFPTWGNFSSVSGKGVVQGYQAIPPGLAPWNLYHSPVFMSPGTPPIPSGHNLYEQTNGIPPGIYIFSKGFVKSSISSQGGWGFFTFDFGL
jgi:hypothetical protein